MPDPRYDVIVIGGGVVGLAVARELARRELSILVLEKDHDVGRGASGRNSGVVHPGFSVVPGTLKAALSVRGARRMRDLCFDLSVPYRQVGTLVVAASEEDRPDLVHKLETGQANGLEGLRIVEQDELEELEPCVAGVAALYAPQGAIVDPRLLTVRLAENVVANGCRIAVGERVEAISRAVEDDAGHAGAGVSRRSRPGKAAAGRPAWRVSTTGGSYGADVIVNAAGVNAPEVSRLAGGEVYDSFPTRGEYLVLDRAAEGVPTRMVYPVTREGGGLGVHYTPTTEGNTLVGPSAENVPDAEDHRTTREVIARLVDEARALCPSFDPRYVIASFAGVRAKIGVGRYGSTDFVVAESRHAPGLVDLVGIESPGLTASPEIAVVAAGLVLPRFPDRPERSGFVARVTAPEPFADLDVSARAARAEADTDSRAIVCRCEQVTRAEVLAALRSPVAASSLAGVKARCRAGTGRCQGGFCTPRVLKLMSEELAVEPSLITAKGPGSEVVVGMAKALFAERGEPARESRPVTEDDRPA